MKQFIFKLVLKSVLYTVRAITKLSLFDKATTTLFILLNTPWLISILDKNCCV